MSALSKNTSGNFVLHTDAIGKTLYTGGKYVDSNIEVPKSTNLTSSAATLTKRYIGEPYSATKAYTQGDVVTSDTGVFYKCKANAPAGTALTNTTYWETTSEVRDKIDVKVTIPAGFYAGHNFTATLEDILPNLTVDAGSPDIKAGSTAYDDQGRAIVGTMPVINDPDGNITMTAGSGSVSATNGRNVPLGTAANSAPASVPYIKVSGSGQVSASYTVASGYHVGGTVTGAATSSNGKDLYYPVETATFSSSQTANTSGFTVESTASNGKYTVTANPTGYVKVTKTGIAVKDAQTAWSGNVSGTLLASAITNESAAGTNAFSATSKYLKVSKEYYPDDRYITVRDAAGLSLEIADKATTAVTIGTKSGNYYPVTQGLSGTISVTTPGWYTGSTLTDSSITVGRVQAAVLGGALGDNGTKYVISATTAGYIKDENFKIDVWDGSHS